MAPAVPKLPAAFELALARLPVKVLLVMVAGPSPSMAPPSPSTKPVD